LCADTSSMTIRYLSLQFIGTSCSSIAQSSSCLCVLSVCRPILYPPEYIVESWLTHLHAIKLIVVCIPNQLYLPISLIMIVPLTHPNPQILHILYALYHWGSCCRNAQGSWCAHLYSCRWVIKFDIFYAYNTTA